MPHPSPSAFLSPAFIVHSLAQAVAVLTAAAETGRPVRLLSDGALAWPAFQALCRLAGEAVPGATAQVAFDPAGRGGFAAEALTQGAAALVFPRRHPQRALLENLAARSGAEILPAGGPALDLAGASDPLAAARAWLLRRPRPRRR